MSVLDNRLDDDHVFFTAFPRDVLTAFWETHITAPHGHYREVDASVTFTSLLTC